MSRPIQIGDIAFIIIDGQEYPLGITDIQSTYIKAGDYILIPVGNHWIVQNYPITHSVRFEVGPTLITHVGEITSQILLSLDYNNLIKACQTNKDFNRVCQDDYFGNSK